MKWMLLLTDDKYYKSSDVIRCKNGSGKFTKAQLNDDFCDCPDGTDEPGFSYYPIFYFLFFAFHYLLFPDAFYLFPVGS